MTKKKKRGNTKNTQANAKTRKCYSRINEITLSLFKIALRGDLKALIIRGEYSYEELEKIKQDLVNDFFIAIESKGMLAHIENMRSRILLENKLFRLASLIHLLRNGSDVTDLLKKQFRVSTLEKAEAKYKSIHLDYMIKLKKEKEPQEVKEQNLYAYFSELQIAVSDKIGFVIKDNDVTLYDFSLMVKRYLK